VHAWSTRTTHNMQMPGASSTCTRIPLKSMPGRPVRHCRPSELPEYVGSLAAGGKEFGAMHRGHSCTQRSSAGARARTRSFASLADCPANTYSLAGSTAGCQQCTSRDANSYSNAGASTCLCKAGFASGGTTGDNIKCTRMLQHAERSARCPPDYLRDAGGAGWFGHHRTSQSAPRARTRRRAPPPAQVRRVHFPGARPCDIYGH